MKPTELKNEYGNFYDWCQKLRNGQIDEDTLLQWITALFPDIEQIKKERLEYLLLVTELRNALAKKDIDVEAAEKRGIDTALTAYESACESLIEEAKRDELQRITGVIERLFPWIRQGVNEKPWQALKGEKDG